MKKNNKKGHFLHPPLFQVLPIYWGIFTREDVSQFVTPGRSFIVINQVPRSSSLVFAGSLLFRSLQPTQSDLHSHRIIQGSQVPTNFRFPSTVPPFLPLLELNKWSFTERNAGLPNGFQCDAPPTPPFIERRLANTRPWKFGKDTAPPRTGDISTSSSGELIYKPLAVGLRETGMGQKCFWGFS